MGSSWHGLRRFSQEKFRDTVAKGVFINEIPSHAREEISLNRVSWHDDKALFSWRGGGERR